MDPIWFIPIVKATNRTTPPFSRAYILPKSFIFATNRTTMRSILLGFLCFFSFASNAQINYEEGDVVNNFTVTTVAGETFDLCSTTAAGQYVVLHFLGDWNFWDEAITPNMNQAFNAFGCGLSDVAFIGLNYSDNGDVSTQTFIDANNYELPVASFDGGSLAVINDFGVNAYPSVILVGPNNQVLSANMYGGPDGTYDVIQATLSQHSISLLLVLLQ